jgi:hypothetical protein
VAAAVAALATAASVVERGGGQAGAAAGEVGQERSRGGRASRG